MVRIQRNLRQRKVYKHWRRIVFPRFSQEWWAQGTTPFDLHQRGYGTVDLPNFHVLTRTKPFFLFYDWPSCFDCSFIRICMSKYTNCHNYSFHLKSLATLRIRKLALRIGVLPILRSLMNSHEKFNTTFTIKNKEFRWKKQIILKPKRNKFKSTVYRH